MDYYYDTASRSGSRASAKQMIPIIPSRRISDYDGSASSSPPSSYYRSPASSTSSLGSSRASNRALTQVSTTSVQTMGSPDRAGYVPGQAPAEYFYDDRARQQWDALQSKRISGHRLGLRSPKDAYWESRTAYGDQTGLNNDGQSIVPEDSISNLGSLRSCERRTEKQYYALGSRYGREEGGGRSHASGWDGRSKYGPVSTQVANGRRVVEVQPV
jgi:hypothetical protein